MNLRAAVASGVVIELATTGTAFSFALSSTHHRSSLVSSSPSRNGYFGASCSNKARGWCPSQHRLASVVGGGGEDFESLGLSDDVLEVARRMNWIVPTPVQRLSIPAILDMAGDGFEAVGNDCDVSRSLWCEGPTGSGKTAGFALPLLQILMQQKRAQHSGRNNYYNPQNEQKRRQGNVSTLILCPTRELAAQTHSVLQRLISYLPGQRKRNNNAGDILIDVIYGGVPVEPQVARLAARRKSGSNIDVLVATPGRLVDVLRHKENVDPTLSALERRIMDALDAKYSDSHGKKRKRRGGHGGKARRRGPPASSSLTLQDIQELDLDRVDDDGRATLDEILHQLDYLVMDEADRLLGGAFKDDMDALLSLFPSSRTRRGETAEDGTAKLRTLLFSATFPEQIEERVDRVLGRISSGVPLRVSTSAAMLQRVPLSGGDEDNNGEDDILSNRQKKHLANTTPIQNVLPDTAPKIQHRIIRLEERDRTQALRFLLEQNGVEDGWDRVLVFVATRYATEHVSRKLRRYGIAAAELHGKLDQEARERRLKSFRAGKTRVLMSTDLAARGIDVVDLRVVVNYDLPRSSADFTHRTGRTGRAGKTGSAITFVSAKSESHFNLIERRERLHNNSHLGKEMIKREVLPNFEPDEASWGIKSAASTMSVPGATHSQKGLVHDRMFGGVKGRRKSKKDKLREAAVARAVEEK